MGHPAFQNEVPATDANRTNSSHLKMADGQSVNVVEENCKEEDFRSLKVQRNDDHSGEE